DCLQARYGDEGRLREIQHAMGCASPSSAPFHLQRLESAGLMLKDRIGNYRVRTRVGVGLVRSYVLIRNMFVPRHVFYAIVMTIASTLYLTLLRDFLSSPFTIIVLLLNTVSAGLFWFESWRDWKDKPRFSGN